jgi:hypothetical protein
MSRCGLRRVIWFFNMRCAYLVPVLVPLVAGCGGGPARVSGRITLNGQPLAHAAVTFQPIATGGHINPGPGSGAFTDSDGRYTLKLIGTDTTGAVVGRHKVRITLAPHDNSADDRQKRSKELPAKYNKKTKLEFDVLPGGTDSADFQLTSP